MFLMSHLLLFILVSQFVLSLLTFRQSFRSMNKNNKLAYLTFGTLILLVIAIDGFGLFIEVIEKSRVLQFSLYCLLLVGIIFSIVGMYQENNKYNFHSANISDLNMLAYESKKIMDNSKSLIAKIDLKGRIVFASANFSKIYNIDSEDIIGQDVFKVNERVGFRDHSWFQKTIANSSSKDESKLIINGHPRWISWNNDVLFDKEGNVEYVISVGHEVTELMEINENLKFKSLHDGLTKLLNYRGLTRSVSNLKNVEKIICFFISIQNFASVQNYYGINIGDEVIKKVGDEFNKYITGGHICARLAGSGFVIMIVNPTEEEAVRIIYQMEESILRDIQIDNFNIHIKRNIGYAVYPDDSDDIMQLVSLANLAMNDSANNEHNEISRYNSYMSKTLADNIKIASKLREAISNSFIDIHFQKIVNTNSDEVVYLEALARWHDDELGYINPSTFINVAKTSNLIDALEEYLIDKAISKFAIIKKQDLYQNSKLSINLSPSSFLHSHFINLIQYCVGKNNIKPEDVCIELSENTFVHNLDLCRYFIDKYKEKGFLIAIDDFGKEYSSLSVLGSITFDVIKIDGSFVTKIHSRKNQAIIEMIVKIASLNNNQIIAESVETKHQAEILRELNCFIQQGYYFHRPEKVIQ